MTNVICQMMDIDLYFKKVFQCYNTLGILVFTSGFAIHSDSRFQINQLQNSTFNLTASTK